MFRAKPIREKLFERGSHRLALAVEADDLHLGGKLVEELAAGTAGCAVILAVANDDDAFEMPKIEFATLTEREQNFLIKTRLLTETEKQALIDKLDELLSHNE